MAGDDAENFFVEYNELDVAGTEYMNKIKEAVIFLIDCQPELF